ncbi:MAG: hypothetical protein ACLQQ4_19185, partial [Bacteroidia bacterium]
SIVVLLLSALPLLVFLGNKSTMRLSPCQDVLGRMLTWQQWINPKSTKKEIQGLLKPSPNEVLSYHTISHTISHPNMNTNYPDIQNEVLYYWNK